VTRISRRAMLVALLTAVPGANAQLSGPCGTACGVVLGATAFTAATGTVVGFARASGGISTPREGLGIWGAGFAAVIGGGVALQGDGHRQRRAVYGAGIGALAGSLLGLGIESTRASSDDASRLAAALIGAAVGTLVGGVYGAVTYPGQEIYSEPTPVLALTLRF
jgi:hypothetical protein